MFLSELLSTHFESTTILNIDTDNQNSDHLVDKYIGLTWVNPCRPHQNFDTPPPSPSPPLSLQSNPL